MNNVNLKLLSPVHVGSGRELQGNAECLFFNDQRKLAVIDEEKVLNVIGVENLDKWVGYIENPESSLIEYLNMRKRGLQPEEVASRVLPLTGTLFPKVHHPLREQIRTLEKPYIPGSSIKGAIRTALFATAMRSKEDLVPTEDLYKGKKLSSTYRLEKGIFGDDPNHDWLRLLRIGDFLMPKGSTKAEFCESINEFKSDQYRMKDEIRILIEYLPRALKAVGSITIAEDLYRETRRKGLFHKTALEHPNSGVNMNDLNLVDVFKRINTHTLHLLEAELDRFADAELPQSAEEYLEELESMLGIASQCAAHECVLRLGFGTGYRTMTGDWVAEPHLVDDETYDDIAKAARRTDRYNHFQLPKTRRVLSGGVPLGFVQLSITQF